MSLSVLLLSESVYAIIYSMKVLNLHINTLTFKLSFLFYLYFTLSAYTVNLMCSSLSLNSLSYVLYYKF